MTMPKDDILTILAQNIAIRGSALPLGASRLTEWSDGLGISKGGKTVLYTGHMYQMMPYLIGMQKRQEKWPLLAKASSIARLLNPVLNLTGMIAIGAVASRDKLLYHKVLRNIVRLLRECDIEFGYLYDREDYAGALAYDMGLDSVFTRHARRVYRRLKDSGVKTLITVDPHTTDILKNVYPQVLGAFDIEVKSYLEVLAERWKHPQGGAPGEDGPVVVHDSCIYARCLNLTGEPRHLLKEVGLTIAEPDLSGRNTHCCGGPIESLYPERARDIAKRRLDQLTAQGHTVVTMCPICHVNLSREAVERRVDVTDISYILLNRSNR